MAQFLVLQIQYAPQLCLKRREWKGRKGKEGKTEGRNGRERKGRQREEIEGKGR